MRMLIAGWETFKANSRSNNDLKDRWRVLSLNGAATTETLAAHGALEPTSMVAAHGALELGGNGAPGGESGEASASTPALQALGRARRSSDADRQHPHVAAVVSDSGAETVWVRAAGNPTRRSAPTLTARLCGVGHITTATSSRKEVCCVATREDPLSTALQRCLSLGEEA